MRKLVTLALIAGSFALVTSTAEAAKTSAAEGRKYSRKYVNKFTGRDFPDLGWKQRDCWRIPSGGVGRFGYYPHGVVCLFTSSKDIRRGGDVGCLALGIAVKEKKRFYGTIKVDGDSYPRWTGDPAACDPGSGVAMPPPSQWGISSDPLRLIV